MRCYWRCDDRKEFCLPITLLLDMMRYYALYITSLHQVTNVLRGQGMKSSHKLPNPSACVVRHLSNSLFECLTDPAYQCDKAVAVNSRYFCRHPNRNKIIRAINRKKPAEESA